MWEEGIIENNFNIIAYLRDYSPPGTQNIQFLSYGKSWLVLTNSPSINGNRK